MSRTQGNNPIRVKKQNETLIKEIIYKYGPISRSQIAEMLSLTPPTITTNVNGLIRQGFVYETSQDEKTEKACQLLQQRMEQKKKPVKAAGKAAVLWAAVRYRLILWQMPVM